MQRTLECDGRRLELLLEDRLPDDGQRAVEAHLSVCPACRTQLEVLAGGQDWWDDVRKNLGTDGASELLLTSELTAAVRRHSSPDLGFLEPSDTPGSLGRLGTYEVLDIVGRGGMGVVLKAFDPALHRPVAIKILASEYAANGAPRKRFAREAQAAAAVIHDHVVPVHAVDANATPPYLVMAFISGRSLQQRLDDTGPLEVKEILRIGMQTASGLAAAHAQGIVHRDIKPANIMLENGVERVRITDFGLARAVDDASVTQSGTLAGTPQYMAPEQARGEVVDQRADLFALGSTMFAMCTGRPPFRGDSGVAVLRQVSDNEPPAIQSINAEIPSWLAGIIKKLHAKEPGARFQTAAEVAELLEQCLAHLQQPLHHRLPEVAVGLAGSKLPVAASKWFSQRLNLHMKFAALGIAIALSVFVISNWVLKKPDRPSAFPKANVEETSEITVPPMDERAVFQQVESIRNRVHLLEMTNRDEANPVRQFEAAAFDIRRDLFAILSRLTESSLEPTHDPVRRQIDEVRDRLHRLLQDQ